MSILINILLWLYVIVCLLMIFVTLMQRPKNEGLGAAFGGGMTENLFGADTTNVLANFTRWLGGVFFVLAMSLAMLYSRNATAKSDIQKELLSKPKPLASATPAASASATPFDAATEAVKQKVLNSVEDAVKKTAPNATPAVDATKGITVAPSTPANSAAPVATPPATVPSASPAASAPSATPAGK